MIASKLRQSRIKRVDRVVDFCETGGEGKHQHHGVEDGAGEKTVVAGGVADGLAEALAGWKFLAIRVAELDADYESALADLVDERVAGFQRSKTGGEVGDFCWESF